MSNEYYRPTYSLEDRDTHRSEPYNPTEVRLYGLRGTSIKLMGAITAIEQSNNVVISVKDKSEKELDKEKLAGIEIGSAVQIATERKQQDVILFSSNPDPDAPLEAGIVFAYAYEGHCYDLPKPKVMLIPAKAKKAIDDDCGFDRKKDYQVWVIDKLEKCIEIEVSQGFVEQLVLSANMPGNRSPSTYRATMAMSHRSGRLTDS